jgi:hypothetical protein
MVFLSGSGNASCGEIPSEDSLLQLLPVQDANLRFNEAQTFFTFVKRGSDFE